jgi:hypothetical protein
MGCIHHEWEVYQWNLPHLSPHQFHKPKSRLILLRSCSESCKGRRGKTTRPASTLALTIASITGTGQPLSLISDFKWSLYAATLILTEQCQKTSWNDYNLPSTDDSMILNIPDINCVSLSAAPTAAADRQETEVTEAWRATCIWQHIARCIPGKASGFRMLW